MPLPIQEDNGAGRAGPRPDGQVCRIKQDAADIGFVYSRRPDDNSIGLIPFTGPGDTVITIQGAKLPFKLVVTLNDTSGGFPGTDTEEEYTMGESLDTVTLSPADADHTYTAARIVRLF